jgi:hypothetical protein
MIYPKVILFSEKSKDPVLDDKLKNVKRIVIDDSLLTNPITYDEIISTCEPKTLWLMDDIDSLTGRLKKEVYRILKLVIDVLRQHEQYICVTSHEGCTGAQSKSQLAGCNVIVAFHSTGYNRSLEYLVKNYVKKKEVKNFENEIYNNSRWFCYIKTRPSVMLFEKELKF